MHLGVEQVRAARALLDWSQKELAERAGISEPSVTNFEKEKSTPNQGTIDKIYSAFSLAGVAFIDRGAFLKEDTVTTIDGNDWYLRLLDDVYYSLIDKKDGELLLICADDRMSPPEVNNRYRKIRNAGIKMRQLVEDGNTYLMGPLKEYRYVPKEHYTNYVCLVYGSKVAVCTDHNSKAVVFNDGMLAAMWSNIFNIMWDTLKQPEKTDAPERF